MPDVTKHIFVSYSHEDQDLSRKVFTHLRGLDQFFPVELWIDQQQIRVGDRWNPEIEKALDAADIAVLLISPAFLASRFITDHELPRLLKRREQRGLRLVPILLHPCAWPEWLASTEIRPRGDLALSEIAAKEPATVDRKLKEVIEEIARLLAGAAVAPAVRGGHDGDKDAPERRGHTPSDLLAATLLAEVSDQQRARIAADLVREIGGYTGLAGDGLYDAVRFVIEWALLRAEDPTSPDELAELLAVARDNDRSRALVNRLRPSGRSADFSAAVEVNSRFFDRTNQRAELWKRYFDTVVAHGRSSENAMASLVRIRVTMGFVAAQFLVAGLLSRFEDDWRPVLNAYQRAIPSPRQRKGAYESLQASQWNCWLMWGPSIPICSCEQWRGFFAVQYGYGDENNSVPVLDLVTGDGGVPKELGPVVTSLRSEQRGAKFAVLTGRLRWGPWFLGPHVPAAQEIVDLAARDELVDEVPSQYGVAVAQRSLYAARGPAHRRDIDGLVFQLEHVDESQPETRVYFSAYSWLMFLVANPSTPPAGPALLRGKPYPAWIDDDERRQNLLRDARLWEDLLPVFVHANIGDPDALRFQKEVLVQNGLHLLRQLWERRAELFAPDDVKAGIHFYLVSASDYSGCGCDVRFPAEESLVQMLRRRLAAEPDRAFAASVVLPATDGADPGRPDELAGYFSACHLPELIAAYYDHVSQAQKGPARL